MEQRDLLGYGKNPPDANWPGGAHVAVSLVLNVEEGSERRISHGDDVNENVYDMIEDIIGSPNLTMESHFDYGTRAGYWRIMRVFDKYGVSCTANCCAEALAISPWLSQDLLARGHEISCHGLRWTNHLNMTEEQERSSILRAIETIETTCGQRPVGWHTRCPHSENTRRLLIEEGGFLYDSDAYDDDLPYLVDAGEKQHVVLPYSLDTNDMRYQRPEAGFVRAKDFADYIIDAFDWLWEEGKTSPKMMTVGLHLRIVGRPGRISGLEQILKHMTQKGSTWFAQRHEIARHWLREHGHQTA